MAPSDFFQKRKPFSPIANHQRDSKFSLSQSFQPALVNFFRLLQEVFREGFKKNENVSVSRVTMISSPCAQFFYKTTYKSSTIDNPKCNTDEAYSTCPVNSPCTVTNQPASPLFPSRTVSCRRTNKSAYPG